jgi:hypothetical protein
LANRAGALSMMNREGSRPLRTWLQLRGIATGAPERALPLLIGKNFRAVASGGASGVSPSLARCPPHSQKPARTQDRPAVLLVVQGPSGPNLAFTVSVTPQQGLISEMVGFTAAVAGSGRLSYHAL